MKFTVQENDKLIAQKWDRDKEIELKDKDIEIEI